MHVAQDKWSCTSVAAALVTSLVHVLGFAVCYCYTQEVARMKLKCFNTYLFLVTFI